MNFSRVPAMWNGIRDWQSSITVLQAIVKLSLRMAVGMSIWLGSASRMERFIPSRARRLGSRLPRPNVPTECDSFAHLHPQTKDYAHRPVDAQILLHPNACVRL